MTEREGYETIDRDPDRLFSKEELAFDAGSSG